mmetsp:Transcript_32733/g.71864  ORF Transcript_32733/g.71864 Transcript_32733/m.71864 type:complete len:258 (+) Transcript_32733:3901-4674(+)
MRCARCSTPTPTPTPSTSAASLHSRRPSVRITHTWSNCCARRAPRSRWTRSRSPTCCATARAEASSSGARCCSAAAPTSTPPTTTGAPRCTWLPPRATRRWCHSCCRTAPTAPSKTLSEARRWTVQLAAASTTCASSSRSRPAQPARLSDWLHTLVFSGLRAQTSLCASTRWRMHRVPYWTASRRPGLCIDAIAAARHVMHLDRAFSSCLKQRFKHLRLAGHRGIGEHSCGHALRGELQSSVRCMQRKRLAVARLES